MQCILKNFLLKDVATVTTNLMRVKVTQQKYSVFRLPFFKIITPHIDVSKILLQ